MSRLTLKRDGPPISEKVTHLEGMMGGFVMTKTQDFLSLHSFKVLKDDLKHQILNGNEQVECIKMTEFTQNRF